MQDHFLVLGPNQMIDDVGRRGVSARVAEPFRANKALDDRSWGMDAAVTT